MPSEIRFRSDQIGPLAPYGIDAAELAIWADALVDDLGTLVDERVDQEAEADNEGRAAEISHYAGFVAVYFDGHFVTTVLPASCPCA